MQNIEGEFLKRLEQLVGDRCSAVHGTAGVGSMITLLFGRRKMMSITLPSFGTFEHDTSDISINLESAAWRLEEDGGLVCSSSSENGVASPMEIGLGKLRAKTILAIEACKPFFDLSIQFSSGLILRVFCDQVESDNYTLKMAPEFFTVGPNGRLEYEMGPED